MGHETTLRIGEVAAQAGVNIQTLRHSRTIHHDEKGDLAMKKRAVEIFSAGCSLRSAGLGQPIT